MKKLLYRSSLLSLALGAILLSSQIVMAGHGSETFMEHIEAAVEPFDSMKIESAHQLPVKTVQSKESYQGGSFKVLARKDSIKRFRCSVCHNDKPVRAQNGAIFTHSDIKLNHGKGKNELSCIECHDPKDRDALIDKQGRKIDYDHSYQLCGQCHFRQKRDWLGGAHGKRETYWAGERVVRNCTSCHNAHSPAFKTKMPETYSLPLDD
jgi:hypothetical protein